MLGVPTGLGRGPKPGRTGNSTRGASDGTEPMPSGWVMGMMPAAGWPAGTQPPGSIWHPALMTEVTGTWSHKQCAGGRWGLHTAWDILSGAGNRACLHHAARLNSWTAPLTQKLNTNSLLRHTSFALPCSNKQGKHILLPA